jgi:hypothetical protein
MKIPDARRVGWQLLVTSLLAMAAVGWSPPADASDDGPPAGWRPLDAQRLDALRGGLVLPTGLVVSFGFERQAWVNGELVSSLRIHVPDVAGMTDVQARELAQLQRTQLVQVGAGNVHDAVAAAGAGLVLQNSLDGAQIRVLTTIDAGTSALGVVQAMNFGDALGRQGLGAVGTP